MELLSIIIINIENINNNQIIKSFRFTRSASTDASLPRDCTSTAMIDSSCMIYYAKFTSLCMILYFHFHPDFPPVFDSERKHLSCTNKSGQRQLRCALAGHLYSLYSIRVRVSVELRVNL